MQTKSIDNLISHKKKIKCELTKSLGLKNTKPLLGIFLDKELSSTQKKMVKAVIEGLNVVDVNVVVLADDKASLEGEGTYLNYSRSNRNKLLQAADMALIFDFSDIEELLLNGIIPISGKRPEIADYNPNHETGNSFIYSKKSPWSVFAALVRAVETFRFPYDWKHIVRQGVRSVAKD